MTGIFLSFDSTVNCNRRLVATEPPPVTPVRVLPKDRDRQHRGRSNGFSRQRGQPHTRDGDDLKRTVIEHGLRDEKVRKLFKIIGQCGLIGCFS